MANIFISYAKADLPRVKPLVDALVQRGWSVWWDRTILAGKTWDDVLEAALNDAGCVIVLWTRHSVQSNWVRTEAEEARQRGILVPVRLDDVNIPLAFKRIQAANLVDWSGVLPSAGFDELARAVSEVLSGAAPRALDEATPSAQAESDTTVVALEAQNIDRENADKKAEEERVAAEATAERGAEAEREEQRLARRRRLLLLFGGLALVCIAGLIWYFATHRSVSPNPEAKPVPGQSVKPKDVRPSPETKLVPGQVRENPKDGLAYVWIPPGRFAMGCSQGDSECGANEKPLHPVNISKGFWMGQTEVTQQAYQEVMGKNPSHFKGSQRPVEQVTWDEASEYCGKVARRLPTEAEWEYAARAGTDSARYGDLDRVAWYRGNSVRGTEPVRNQQPNSWGLYDMLGNVSEWVADRYGEKYYEAGEATDPAGPQSDQPRIMRGGSWSNTPSAVRASYRSWLEPTYRLYIIGFRCAGELP